MDLSRTSNKFQLLRFREGEIIQEAASIHTESEKRGRLKMEESWKRTEGRLKLGGTMDRREHHRSYEGQGHLGDWEEIDRTHTSGWRGKQKRGRERERRCRGEKAREEEKHKRGRRRTIPIGKGTWRLGQIPPWRMYLCVGEYDHITPILWEIIQIWSY